MNQVNNPFWENMDSEVGRIVWETIIKLGISSKEEKIDSVKAIKIMGNRDKEGNNMREEEKKA